MQAKVMNATVEARSRLAEIGGEIAAGASQVKEMVADAVEHNMELAREAARSTIKRGRHAAEDMLDTTAYRVKRHPFQSTGITFGAGAALGFLIGYLARHKCE